MQKLQDLLWLWMILGFTIMPAVRQWIIQIRRRRVIAQLEQARGTKVITMIHRQSSGLLGMLFMRYINLDDSERLLEEIRRAGEKPIDLLVHTPGGLVVASEQIARALHRHKAGVAIIVPQYAMSGGTLLALAADQILLDENAMLGPVDPQLNGMPAGAYLRVLQEKERNAIQDQTIMMADVAEKATAQLWQMAFTLLEGRLGEKRAKEVATALTDGRWTHDYPLHVEQLRELGLPVSTEVPAGFRQLLGLSNPAQPQVMRKVTPQKEALGG